MKKAFLALSILGAVVMAAPAARADDVGAVFGGVTGMFVAGPPGAIAGVIIGGIWGRPFWGPPIGPGACWIDSDFHRHCGKLPVDF